MALDRPPIAAEIRATLAVAAPLAAANLAQMAMQVTNAVMVGHLGAVPLAAAGLGNEPGLVAEIGRFLWAISWGIPGFLGAAVLRFLLIAAFRTRIVMIVPLLAVPLNLVLNWVLIFGHWGMPALGSAGSGCATAMVQSLTFFSFALYLLIARAQGYRSAWVAACG